MGKHTEQSALAALDRKHDVQVRGKDIRILTSDSPIKGNDLGNKTWGKISYLVNHCGYTEVFVYEF